jgi:hypothetical protein
MADWTYAHQYLKLDRKRTRDLAVLDERAADGWELVSAVPLGKRARRSAKADVLLLFKRLGVGSSDSDVEVPAVGDTEHVNGQAEQPSARAANGEQAIDEA